jgi:hypothetical protein
LYVASAVVVVVVGVGVVGVGVGVGVVGMVVVVPLLSLVSRWSLTVGTIWSFDTWIVMGNKSRKFL